MQRAPPYKAISGCKKVSLEVWSYSSEAVSKQQGWERAKQDLPTGPDGLAARGSQAAG